MKQPQPLDETVLASRTDALLADALIIAIGFTLCFVGSPGWRIALILFALLAALPASALPGYLRQWQISRPIRVLLWILHAPWILAFIGGPV